MILTKEQIKKLEKSLKKAQKYEIKAQNEARNIASLIEEFTGVVGYVDYLAGDGFGFTPESNDDTHVGIDDIIKLAKQGIDINHYEIDSRRSF